MVWACRALTLVMMSCHQRVQFLEKTYCHDIVQRSPQSESGVTHFGTPCPEQLVPVNHSHVRGFDAFAIFWSLARPKIAKKIAVIKSAASAASARAADLITA